MATVRGPVMEQFAVVAGAGSLRSDDSAAGDLEDPLDRVDRVAEIPRAIRAGAPVRRS